MSEGFETITVIPEFKVETSWKDEAEEITNAFRRMLPEVTALARRAVIVTEVLQRRSKEAADQADALLRQRAGAGDYLDATEGTALLYDIVSGVRPLRDAAEDLVRALYGPMDNSIPIGDPDWLDEAKAEGARLADSVLAPSHS